MNYKSKLNALKIALGIEVKMAEAILNDGVTRVEAEAFEAGKKIFVVSESGEKAPAPAGTHTTEDGTVVTVDELGTIVSVEKPEAPVDEIEVEAAANENVPDVMDETVEPGEPLTIEPEEMKKLIMQCMEAIEEVAKEVAVVKEEMAAYKTKMEKMSKTPAATKLSTFNSEAAEGLTPLESRLEAIEKLRTAAKAKRKF